MSIKSVDEQLYDFELAKNTILAYLTDYPILQQPKFLIICGSGLGGLSTLLHEPKISIPYTSIPGFKASTVAGHSGELVFGLLGLQKTPVMCMVGRFHYYEGYSFYSNTLPIRVAALMKVTHLIVTNAAGGVNSDYSPGELMVIDDHINFPGIAGQHPLRGPNIENFGPRFLPLSDAYDFELRLKFFECVKKLGITRKVHEGVYFYASGPTFESRAECRMIRTLGADAVGMSTVPEVIVGRHCGLKVFGLSLITNAVLSTEPVSAKKAVEDGKSVQDVMDQSKGMASHNEVLEAADAASKDVKKLVELFVDSL